MNATMKATLPAAPTYNGLWPSGNKEQVQALAVIACSGRGFIQPVTIRWWMSRRLRGAGSVYCSIWADGCAGHGRARGYGYDKKSAALGEAIRSAGILLSESIDGRGNSASCAAAAAIARACGYRKFTVVEL